MEDYTITVLGCGVMGTAVVSAILNTTFDNYPKRIICCTNSEKGMEKLKENLKNNDILEFSYGANNSAAVSKADIIILGCKPYMYQDVHAQVKSALTGSQLVISLLAGVTLSELEIFSSYVSKVMTNTPAKFGCGTAAISISPSTEKFTDLITSLINPIGLAFHIPEKNMDAATALVGSGPAFCLLMMESLIDGGVRMGLPYEIARLSAAKVMEGTAKMVLESGDHPAVLKSKVCTPGGTTIGGLLKMEDAGVRAGIARGVEEAAIISKSFAKK